MKYYIIAGEASGDLHASNLIKELKNIDTKAKFRGWGGDLMLLQGTELVKHYHELAFMGFIEVLANLRTILNNLSLCKEDIASYKPDVIILIDYPGFNLKIAKFAHKNGIKVFYYISPQLWAWHQSRIKTIKKYVDKMFVILPFEKEFYKKHDLKVDFVGHPLLDVLEDFVPIKRDHFIKKNNLQEKPVIALLPGSRKQEISMVLPIMLNIIPQYYEQYQFVVAATTSISYDFYQSICKNFDIEILYNQTYDLLKNSEAALVTSGTATLEAAFLETPEVVCYKGSPISFWIAKRFVKIKYIGIANLIMNKQIMVELIQDDCNPFRLKQELDKLMTDLEYRKKMLSSFKDIKKKIGGKGASRKTAELMIKYLKGS